MKKVLILAIAAGVVVVIAKAVKDQSARPKPSIFEKIKEFMDSMPEDFPPRIMFENVAAIRENTERMVAALEKSGIGKEPATV